MGWLSGRGRGQCGDGEGHPVSAGAESPSPAERFITIYFPTVYSGRKQASVGINSSVSRHPGAGSAAQKDSSEGAGVSPRMLESVWHF